MTLPKKWEAYAIAEQIHVGGITIILFDSHQFKTIPIESISNIIAIGNDNKFIWEAEPPTTKYDIYFKIYLKGNYLMARSGGGQLHQLDIKTGKIVDSFMTK